MPSAVTPPLCTRQNIMKPKQWLGPNSPHLCFDSLQLCSQQFQVSLQALNLEIPAGQKSHSHGVLAQTAFCNRIVCADNHRLQWKTPRLTCHRSLHLEVQTSDQICPVAEKESNKKWKRHLCTYSIPFTCKHLWLVCTHTCGCACTLDVETSLTSMRGSGSSSSSSCCSGSSSSGMTTTGFTCLASEAACRKLGGDWRGDKKKRR